MIPTFCLRFAFTGIKFRGKITITKTRVDQSEVANIGAQINELTICYFC